MRLKVLALDYDGTIAEDGRLDPDVRDAIDEARAHGLIVILVTGRILEELRRLAGDLRLFDAIVAENGAVYTIPAGGQSRVLGPPPTTVFLQTLRERGIDIVVGECVVETDAHNAQKILEVVQELELPLALAFNRGRLMVLPQAISKSTGLREVLTAMRLSAHNAIAIGDAENDHDLLNACEVGVAVAWGSDALKQVADEVIEGPGAAAVAAYIRTLIPQPVVLSPRGVRRRLLLGHDDSGRSVALAVRGRNVLVAGEPRTGKSWIAGLLCEQLILHRYCLCVIDPEGDYASLEPLPDVIVRGGDDLLPRPREIIRTLRHPDVSLVIDLSQRSHSEKIQYVRTLLPMLATLRRRFGLPHRIVLDEAHYFLHDDTGRLLDPDMRGYTLVTYRASALPRAILQATEAVIVSRESDSREVASLASFCAKGADTAVWLATVGQLPLGEAAVLPCAEESEGELRRIRLVPRFTSHVRHRSKYVDVPAPEPQAFVFTQNGQPTGCRVRTLREFVAVVAVAPTPLLDRHLRQGDFSRWIDDVYGDHPLASQFRQLEERYRSGLLLDANDALVQLISARYELDEASPSEHLTVTSGLTDLLT